MVKYSPPDEDDLIFFYKAMQDVKRRRKSLNLTVTVKKIQKSSLNRSRESESIKEKKRMAIPFFPLSDPVEQTITAEDRLFFRRAGGLQDKVIKKLTRGEMIRRACLDLHGMTVEQARLAVVEFLCASQKAGFRCIQIIHGKGQLRQIAKLKNHVNYWLVQFPTVLAFCSAQAKDGGTGAVYVLLAKSSFKLD